MESLTDDREPADILARILAHLGHRIPLLRRVERRLEGTDASSGIGSDVIALVSTLYLRNRETLTSLVEQAKQEAAKRKAAAKAQKDNGAGDAGKVTVPPIGG